ncbi:MAG: DNA-directed RNA polymerase subunit D [archaeon]|nr:DNA-directed RNA polymerase subunit D [Candidatus Micrarchaeota archaeon]
MDIKVLEKKENSAKFLIKGVNTAFMNALRRTMANSIPVLAIENVNIYENSSVMFDEMLAHRLGLIPIKTETKKYGKGEKVNLVLEKEGPGMIYSRDLKGSVGVEVVDKRVPIVKLGKNQKIKLEMEAVIGTGKEHTKWSPALVSYNELPSIDNLKECNLCKKCVEACSKNILEVKAKKIILKDPTKCDLCGACKDECKEGNLELSYSKDTFIMRIESTGGLEVKEIIEQAVNTLEEKTAEFKKELNKV